MDKFKLILAGIAHNRGADIEVTEEYENLYKVGGQRYVSYKKHISNQDKKNFIAKNMSEFIYDDAIPFIRDDSFQHMKMTLIYFCHVNKNEEHRIMEALWDKRYSPEYWERWAFFDNGSLLTPSETENLLGLIEKDPSTDFNKLSF